MPCYDPRDNPSVQYVDRKVNTCTVDQLDAILCGVLDVDRFKLINHKGLIWDLVDWQEVGMSPSVAKRWHEEHKRTDARKKAERKAAEEQKKLRSSGLSKLTEDELAALGLSRLKKFKRL